jgi:hypothetical protein
MQYEHLLTLASAYAQHIDRSLKTVARHIGLHSIVFERLARGEGCRVDTFNKAMGWFLANWPADLDWPADVPRPDVPQKKRRAA